MKARPGVMTAAVASKLTASSRTAFMLDDTQFVADYIQAGKVAEIRN